jgi:hypothetical protein
MHPPVVLEGPAFPRAMHTDGQEDVVEKRMVEQSGKVNENEFVSLDGWMDTRGGVEMYTYTLAPRKPGSLCSQFGYNENRKETSQVEDGCAVS